VNAQLAADAGPAAGTRGGNTWLPECVAMTQARGGAGG